MLTRSRSETGYVFPGERGNTQLSRPIKAFKRICRAAGLVNVSYRIHDLRHAWCSAAIFAAVPLEIVSHGVRHSSPVMTRRYVHPHEESLRNANDQVAKLIANDH